MIIILKPGHRSEDVTMIEDKVRALGYEPHTIRGVVRTVIAAVGDETANTSLKVLDALPIVDRVLPIQKPYKLVSREAQSETTIVRVGSAEIGGNVFHVAAGPCAVESVEQITSTATSVAASGATLLRGGAFKPRTSPYAFQGLGTEGLDMMLKAKADTGLPIVSEVVRETDIAAMLPVVDVMQIGARNALNYSLLTAVAETGVPVLLKRGMASTIEEWLLAAEYLVKNGNPNVILCERGIRTYETATRNTLDISAVALAKKECNLPVFVDPSHAAGRRDLITPLCYAAIAAGADGLLVEVHPDPESATSDVSQQLPFDMFAQLMTDIEPFVEAAGKTLAQNS
jgi:3-deoxy-7-phosphoheptulonate synthase